MTPETKLVLTIIGVLVLAAVLDIWAKYVVDELEVDDPPVWAQQFPPHPAVPPEHYLYIPGAGIEPAIAEARGILSPTADLEGSAAAWADAVMRHAMPRHATPPASQSAQQADESERLLIEGLIRAHGGPGSPCA